MAVRLTRMTHPITKVFIFFLGLTVKKG